MISLNYYQKSIFSDYCHLSLDEKQKRMLDNISEDLTKTIIKTGIPKDILEFIAEGFGLKIKRIVKIKDQ